MKKFLVFLAIIPIATSCFVLAVNENDNRLCTESPWLSVCKNSDKVIMIKGVEDSGVFTIGRWTNCEYKNEYEVVAIGNNESYYFGEDTFEKIVAPVGVSPRIYQDGYKTYLILPEGYQEIDKGKNPICQ